MGKYLDLLDRAALQEQRRDKSDKSDKNPPRTAAPALFDRLCRFGRSPESAGSKASWDEASEERAAIVEYDGGVPRAWAEGLARLDPNKPPADVPPERWLRFIDDCGHFLDAGWADQAVAIGWRPLDLFGCDRERPFARIDRLGLLWLIDGRKLAALTKDTATIQSARGTHQSYYRRPIEVGRVVLAWELADAENL